MIRIILIIVKIEVIRCQLEGSAPLFSKERRTVSLCEFGGHLEATADGVVLCLLCALQAGHICRQRMLQCRGVATLLV